jgi:hypothetical protein
MFPIAVTQEPLIELARGQTAQFGLEVNRAWAFLARQVRGTERLQFLDDLRSGQDIRHKLDNGFDLLSEIVVGDTEYSGVGDLRMCDEQVLALLRVNVHAAGDDHERGAVGEIEVAALIDIADIADGVERAVSS